jgi:CBS domain-containing protein
MSTLTDIEEQIKQFECDDCDEPIDRALAECSVLEMTITPFVVVSPETSIEVAVNALVNNEIACVMVARGERLVGLFSEWDVLNRVAGYYSELARRPVSEAMTCAPFYVSTTDSVACALSIIALCGYRHIPVLDEHERIVGILSPSRIAAFLAEKAARSA